MWKEGKVLSSKICREYLNTQAVKVRKGEGGNKNVFDNDNHSVLEYNAAGFVAMDI